MPQTKTDHFVQILQGKIPIQRSSYKGYCTAGNLSVVDAALQRQTGIPAQSFNPSSTSVTESCVGRKTKKPKKSSDSDFQEYLKKYINGA